MGKYDQLATEILNQVGGRENILSLVHCVTRLRFNLKDETKANDERLKEMDGVIAVMHSAGQYQVVVGNHVPQVYEAVCRLGKIETAVSTEKKKMSFKEKSLDFISGIMMPSIALLCACGMLKGLNTCLSFLGLYAGDSGIAMMLNAIGDSIFFFLPIVIGYNTAKKLEMNPYIGMVIGAALCYPTINNADVNVMGYVVKATYTSTLLPVILIVMIAKPLETFFNKTVHDMVKTFMTPMLVLLVSVPLGFVVIGPLANWVSNVISQTVLSAYQMSPIVAGLLVGGLWQVLIIFGVHIVLVVLCINNIVSGHPDPILAFTTFVSFSTTGIVLAIWLKTKDKVLKQVALPAWISGIFGVTEPAIYGILLPRMKQFVISCLVGAVAGAGTAILGLKYHTMAGMGIFEIPALLDPAQSGASLMKCLLLTGISFAIGFVVMYFTYNDEPTAEQPEGALSGNKTRNAVFSPMVGAAQPLNSVKDAAFSEGALGKGIAVTPTVGTVVAPFDGVVVSLFPTHHAIGVLSNAGCELLIHVGMDTVQLQGKYFKAHVQQGDKLKKGDLMITFDLEGILAEGYSLETPIIVTNTGEYLDVLPAVDMGKTVEQGQELLIAL